MAPDIHATNTEWSTEYDTVRREKLFKSPPKDRTAYPLLAAAVAPHVESFNRIFGTDGLLEHGIKDIGAKAAFDGDPRALRDASSPPRNKFSVRLKEVQVGPSVLPDTNKHKVRDRRVYPAECRERHSTYHGRLMAWIEIRINDGSWQEVSRDLGPLPLMLMSKHCHLHKMTPDQLVKAKEESEELGGYFIVNGNEKLARFLIMPRRNYPMAISRPAFANRGKAYTRMAVQIRSVRPDQTSQTNILHYLDDGNIMFRFSFRKNEYLVHAVMILKALVETNDREIFEGVIGSAGAKDLSSKQFVMDRLEVLLRSYKHNHSKYGVHRRDAARASLGKLFRVPLQLPDDMSDEKAGGEFLRKVVLPHLGANNVTERDDRDKFRMLLFMIQKLYALADGECSVDNPDAVQNQEILLPGFLYGIILKEKLEEWLKSICAMTVEWSRSKNWKSFTEPDFLKDFSGRVLRRTNEKVGDAMDYFLATGNLVSPSGLDMQQRTGFTIVAEKLNYLRFISHFRAVHRGAFFATLKTTTVRKLLPESWGFLCPVHTPDGSPCGLLNHLSHKCQISTKSIDVSKIPDLVAKLGATSTAKPTLEESVVVQLDGRILGFCSPTSAKTIADSLRYWKVEGTNDVPPELEIGYVPPSNGGQYPGIFMSSGPARMLRPVKYLPLDKQDYVGPFEQPYMSIACTEPEIVPGDSTHVEFDPTNILSIVANQTPFSESNQSPRNMYQCQMAKQTMGTPGTALRYRTDNKAYRLQTGQTPVVRAPLHNSYGFDNFPNGTNAVVAVISYTGYDMDDAMIINKSAHERGFGHGSIYKTKKYDLDELSDSKERRAKTRGKATALFGFAPSTIVTKKHQHTMDLDGLPAIGTKVSQGDFIVAWHHVTFEPTTGEYENRDGRTMFVKYKDAEDAFIEEVRIIGSDNGSEPCRSISVKFRVPRSPVIGDKFSSRHGQKGVCSQKWKSVDMPFSESGSQPDVIINPHAFPSRMTIGMFIESLAGKAGALHGLAQDCTPFSFSEENTAVDYFGEQLRKAGYAYHGSEPMYSGITGQELHADIFLGVVYYQRLRHMVGDKFQVRSTGSVDPLTNQPLKGRSRGGGIRFGEMERDALISHGTEFLLQDRLMNCSDRTTAHLCRQCGVLFSTQPVVAEFGRRFITSRSAGQPHNQLVRCRNCAKSASGWEAKGEVWEDGQGGRWVGGEDVTMIDIPGVILYLATEIASMGFKMKLRVKD